jgi:putative ABC transport system permease protein
VVIATLALGIGAVTAVFTVFDDVLLEPLPYPEADRLVRLYQTSEEFQTSPNPRLQWLASRLPLAYLNALDLRRESRHLVGVGLYEERTADLQLGGEPERVSGARIDEHLLAVLGVQPLLGRTFIAEEVETGAPVVLLSHALWQRALGGSPTAIGQVLRLDDVPHTIVGVLPPGFRIPGDEGVLWTPLALSDADRSDRGSFTYSALGRLASGATLEVAQGEADRLAAELEAAHPEEHEGTGLRLVPLQEVLAGGSRSLLVLLLAAVGVVWLVACVNVAHLQLAEAQARQRDVAIRAALGARQRQLLGAPLVEACLVSLAAGGVGLLLAVLSRPLLHAWLPLPGSAGAPQGSLDATTLLFVASLSGVTALLCALPSAVGILRGVRRAPQGLLLARGARGGGGVRAHEALVVVEVALTLALTLGAGLLVHSYLRLSAVEPGFRAQGLLAQEIRLPPWRYTEAHRRMAFAEGVVAALEREPEVAGVALTTRLPFPGRSVVGGFRIPGRDTDPEARWTQGRSATREFVTPGYFQLLGIPLLEGRDFTAADRPERGRVVIVNRTLATAHWPGQSAVGERILMGREAAEYTVVGVVADVHHEGLAVDPGNLLYQPWSQGDTLNMAAVVAFRGEGSAGAGAVELRRTLRGLDPNLPVAPPVAFSDLLGQNLQAPRSRTVAVGVLAAVALFLALLGTYAVVSLSVQRRVPEIGVRMALGATAEGVGLLILRRTLVLAALGVALGTVASLWTRGLLEGLLYAMGPLDPLAFAGAAGLLLIAAALAAYLPSRRAGRVDPARTLQGH